MTQMRLILIGRDGRPAEAHLLNETARAVCDGIAAMYGRTGFEPQWVGYLAEDDVPTVVESFDGGLGFN